MTLLHRSAEALMTLAAVLAPRSRQVWVDAMRAELAAIEKGGQALAWAGGAFAAASGWRAAREAPAVLMVGAIWFVLPILLALPFFYFAGLKQAGEIDTATFMALDRTVHTLVSLTFYLGCALYRPRVALAAALIVPTWQAWPFLTYVITAALADPLSAIGNEPELPNWLFLLMSVLMFSGPGVAGVGAALVWRRFRHDPVATT